MAAAVGRCRGRTENCVNDGRGVSSARACPPSGRDPLAHYSEPTILVGISVACAGSEVHPFVGRFLHGVLIKLPAFYVTAVEWDALLKFFPPHYDYSLI